MHKANLNDLLVLLTCLLDSLEKVPTASAEVFHADTISGPGESRHVAQVRVCQAIREIVEKIQPRLRNLTGWVLFRNRRRAGNCYVNRCCMSCRFARLLWPCGILEGLAYVHVGLPPHPRYVRHEPLNGICRPFPHLLSGNARCQPRRGGDRDRGIHRDLSSHRWPGRRNNLPSLHDLEAIHPITARIKTDSCPDTHSPGCFESHFIARHGAVDRELEKRTIGNKCVTAADRF